MKNIILIGFMGCGKTTVGKILSKKLGLKFIDTDEETEKSAGMTISRIFEEFGENRFRDIETEILEKVCAGENRLISTGGGIILREKNIEIMKSGKVYFLNTPMEIVEKRLAGNTTRPLAAGGLDRLRKLHAERLEKYLSAADAVIDSLDKEEICDRIIRLHKGGN